MDTHNAIDALAALAGTIREKGTPFVELGLADPALTDDQLVDAMMAHPILINRPFVITPLGTRLCRPAEAVLDILPERHQGAFTKEDGEQVPDAGASVLSESASRLSVLVRLCRRRQTYFGNSSPISRKRSGSSPQFSRTLTKRKR